MKPLFVVLAAPTVSIASAPAHAVIVFTSEPPTSAAVGQAYAYKMTATRLSFSDEDDRNDRDDRDDRDDGDDRDGRDDGDDRDDRDDRDDDKDRFAFIARALPRWLEFDGNDTIFGTPRPEDVGVHEVKLRARARDDRADQEFTITVDAQPSGPPAEGGDLAASMTVAPNPVPVGDVVTFHATARNVADADVANFVLETAFSGDAPFSVDDVDDQSCSIEPRGEHTAVVCRWAPLMSGRSRSARVSGHASGPGEILALARVTIVDALPVDRNPVNDEAQVVLRITGDGQNGGAPDSGDSSPIMTLNGAPTVTVIVGETYEDAGATAVDDVDGDLTSLIVVDNPVDTSVIGRYSVTYDVRDSAGNLTTVTRTVEVVPREPAGGGGAVAEALLLVMVIVCAICARRV